MLKESDVEYKIVFTNYLVKIMRKDVVQAHSGIGKRIAQGPAGAHLGPSITSRAPQIKL